MAARANKGVGLGRKTACLLRVHPTPSPAPACLLRVHPTPSPAPASSVYTPPHPPPLPPTCTPHPIPRPCLRSTNGRWMPVGPQKKTSVFTSWLSHCIPRKIMFVHYIVYIYIGMVLTRQLCGQFNLIQESCTSRGWLNIVKLALSFRRCAKCLLVAHYKFWHVPHKLLSSNTFFPSHIEHINIWLDEKSHDPHSTAI